MTTSIAALGIVYGDLGTSPLYTFQTVVGDAGGRIGADVALGSLSLIVWALILTISIKYCLIVMRADNQGEGGILALMSMLSRPSADHLLVRGGWLIAAALLGAALIYGDGIITPAISVLSALEGLNVATTVFKPYVLPLSVAVLVALFLSQPFGTAKLGRLFGPVMLLWFATIGLMGLAAIARSPGVLVALNPLSGARFLITHGWGSFVVLGGVFLALTGGEALYADMGHFGRRPVRIAWTGIVLPALLLNYAGQAAQLLRDPKLSANPFFSEVPNWGVYPLVVLATLATIIASQAIITGAFSLTRQAIQLGWLPSLSIRQTSDQEYGQIYVPVVNWIMMVATLAITVAFGSSARLTGAFGTAVSTTMMLTTLLLFDVMRRRWNWSLAATLPVVTLFLLVDVAFFCANLLKILDGGYIPLVFGTTLFVVMVTWHRGRRPDPRRSGARDEGQRRHAEAAADGCATADGGRRGISQPPSGRYTAAGGTTHHLVRRPAAPGHHPLCQVRNRRPRSSHRPPLGAARARRRLGRRSPFRILRGAKPARRAGRCADGRVPDRPGPRAVLRVERRGRG